MSIDVHVVFLRFGLFSPEKWYVFLRNYGVSAMIPNRIVDPLLKI